MGCYDVCHVGNTTGAFVKRVSADHADWPIFSSDEGVTLETSALKLFTAANLRYRLS